MRKISITEALNELKLYDAKITKKIGAARFVGTAKKSDSKIGVMEKPDFNKEAIASYQSIMDLIRNRNAVKSAIVKSNAVTQVTVHNKTMTVAEAIERKNSIHYEEDLLRELDRQYTKVSELYRMENKRVDEKINTMLLTLIGKESQQQASREEQEAIEKPYREKNEYEFIDPIGISRMIANLEDDIEGFKAEVDTRLSVSNSITYIEVES